MLNSQYNKILTAMLDVAELNVEIDYKVFDSIKEFKVTKSANELARK